MKVAGLRLGVGGRAACLMALLGVGLTLNISAESVLVVTEVMSQVSITHHGVPANHTNVDWVEFTVYGNTPLNVTGWWWTDNSERQQPPGFPTNMVMNPGDSIIFYRSNALEDTVENFLVWWGGCLTTTNIIPFYGFGFSGDEGGDSVRLYETKRIGPVVYTNLIDEIFFPEAQRGVSFVSDINTGEFGLFSLGYSETCPAATTDDLGSPGRASPAIALFMIQQPLSLSNLCAGSDPVICAQAGGLPRGKYQWQFMAKGLTQWQPVPGATRSCLTIQNAQAAAEGQYRVVVTNGLETIYSAPAWLTVDTNYTAPRLLSELVDVERYEGEKATFTAVVCANPPAQFQWFSNHVAIAGATNRTLSLPRVTNWMNGWTYRVGITNPLGFTNLSARLWVCPWPRLTITEVAPANFNKKVYWELTNLGGEPVKLRKGFRHLDSTAWRYGRSVDQDVLIQPGESVIFVDRLSRQDFFNWWGEPNLPPNLQVITFFGYGLNEWSDIISLWSDAAEADQPTLAQLDYAFSVFPDPPTCPCPDPEAGCPPGLCGHPIYGHSVYLSPYENDCAYWGLGSEENSAGAFLAASTNDAGSPGWTPWTPPYLLSVTAEGTGTKLVWRAIPGTLNQVQYKTTLNDPNWVQLADISAARATMSYTTPNTQERRYYRVVNLGNGRASKVFLWPPISHSAPIKVACCQDCQKPMSLTWQTEPGFTYVVQQSRIITGPWSGVWTNNATGSALTFTNMVDCGTAQLFYRVICPASQ